MECAFSSIPHPLTQSMKPTEFLELQTVFEFRLKLENRNLPFFFFFLSHISQCYLQNRFMETTGGHSDSLHMNTKYIQDNLGKSHKERGNSRLIFIFITLGFGCQ